MLQCTSVSPVSDAIASAMQYAILSAPDTFAYAIVSGGYAKTVKWTCT